MSLINDMLRDLDARNAAASERGGLAQNVRALPGKAEGRRLHPVLLVLSIAVLAAGLAWRLLQPPEHAAAPATQPQPSSPAPAAVAEPTIAVPPLEQALITPAAEPQPTDVVPTAATGLRLETQISTPPATMPPTPITPTAAKPVPAEQPKTAAAPAPRTAETTAPTPPTRSNALPQISKQPVAAGTPLEQAEGEYQRALNALRRGAYGEGGDALRNALRLHPAHVAARQTLLAQMVEQKQWQDAATLALDGVGLLPQRSDWAMLAARIMYEQGETEEALSVLNRHAAAGRQNADYQILHALLLQRTGRHGDAAICYQTALALRPNEGRWWYGLGRALDADNRDAEARQAYERARSSGNLPLELQQNVERRLR